MIANYYTEEPWSETPRKHKIECPIEGCAYSFEKDLPLDAFAQMMSHVAESHPEYIEEKEVDRG